MKITDTYKLHHFVCLIIRLLEYAGIDTPLCCFFKYKGLYPLRFLPPKVCISAVLNITSQLVLPISFLLLKGLCVSLLHFVYKLDG